MIFYRSELLHFLLIELKLGRHYKGQFKVTKRGAAMLAHPSQLLNTLVPFYIFNIDHSGYSRSGEQPLGTWDVWLNVLNVEAENAATELELYEVFYGPLSDEEPMAWRATSAFYSCVLRPLCWAGVLLEHRDARLQAIGCCVSQDAVVACVVAVGHGRPRRARPTALINQSNNLRGRPGRT